MWSKEQILKYINYYSDGKIQFYQWIPPEKIDNGYSIRGYDYDEGVKTFLDDFYKSDFIDYEYNKSIERVCTNGITPEDLINTADIQLLKSILTYYIRTERFSEGTLAKAIDKEIFLRIFLKLKEIID